MAAIAAASPSSPLSGADRPRLGESRGAAAAFAPHRRAIVAAFRSGGVPGWMRLKGEAYALGETRYGLIVEILMQRRPARPTSKFSVAPRVTQRWWMARAIGLRPG